MKPTLLSIGIFDFHAYTVCMALGFLVGTILTVQQNYKLPRPYDITPAGGLVVFLFALVGAKVYWFIQYGNIWEIYQALYIWQGGLVFYGGLFGGILGAWIYLKWVKASFLGVGDIAVCYLALAHSIARVGCFLNGCCWGAVSAVPWAVEFPRGTSPYYDHLEAHLVEPGSQHSLPVHPTQLYEAGGLFLIFLLMRFVFYPRHQQKGSMIMLYFFLYGMLRFTVEQFRGDSAHPLFGMTASQLVALSMMLGASFLFVVCKSSVWNGKTVFGRKKAGDDPESPPPAAPEATEPNATEPGTV